MRNFQKLDKMRGGGGGVGFALQFTSINYFVAKFINRHFFFFILQGLLGGNLEVQSDDEKLKMDLKM